MELSNPIVVQHTWVLDNNVQWIIRMIIIMSIPPIRYVNSPIIKHSL